MSTNILGVSAHYHDSAACLISDGVVVAAAQEEAFTRRKHDRRFPVAAMRYCLEAAGLTLADVDWYAYYELPELKRQRVAASARAYYGSGPSPAALARSVAARVGTDLGGQFPRASRHTRLFAVEHHASHAGSAFYPSPFEEAAVMTIDGVGEFCTATIGVGTGRELRLLRQISFPHSLGLLYSAFTYYCGFTVNEGEYKLMGLAPYGRPRYADTIRSHLVRAADDGSFRLNLDYFAYLDPAAAVLINPLFEALLGRPARRPDEPIDEFFADIAASIQAVFEFVVVAMARHARSLTGLKNLCLAGGCMLNCVANARISAAGVFDRVWVQPAAGDAGGALGAAAYLWHGYLGNPRTAQPGDSMSGALLGPSYDDETIRLFLESVGARYTTLSESDLVDRTAGLLAEGKIVGWYQGRLEFGPRALGDRSILADPRPADMQRRLNLSIKDRETFRPFAPAVPVEDVGRFFESPDESPYMLFTAPVADAARGDIPAVTHVDYSARLQTVDRTRNSLFWSLITRFGELTGVPVVVNTSFNGRGEPIVCSPEDAMRCFLRTGIDAVVMGHHLVLHRDQERITLE